MSLASGAPRRERGAEGPAQASEPALRRSRWWLVAETPFEPPRAGGSWFQSETVGTRTKSIPFFFGGVQISSFPTTPPYPKSILGGPSPPAEVRRRPKRRPGASSRRLGAWPGSSNKSAARRPGGGGGCQAARPRSRERGLQVAFSCSSSSSFFRGG